MIMGKTNQCVLQQNEKLAEEVRKYPCLYDKAEVGYKDKLRKVNAWAKIDETFDK